MLTYLDAVCDAMTARDRPRLRDLVEDHPLARLLPTEVMGEVRRFLSARIGAHAVPLAMLRFRDQTARLLNESLRADPASTTAAANLAVPAPSRRRPRATAQTELPLSA